MSRLNVDFLLQEDDSLRRWKEKLLGCLESDLNGLYLALSLDPSKYFIPFDMMVLFLTSCLYC